MYGTSGVVTVSVPVVTCAIAAPYPVAVPSNVPESPSVFGDESV